MLTLFTIPKAFDGHIGVIQRNAIESWRRLDDDVEILLLGDDPGVREVAAKQSLRHIAEIETNKHGTPLVNHAFRLARQHARHETLCYVNADIILTSDLVRAVERLEFPEFVMTGRRCNVEIDGPLKFDEKAWEQRLWRRLRDQGELALRWAMDYFVIRGTRATENMPPFAVGRPMWDNWLIYNACQQNIPVIDAGTTATAVHQNHGYDHVAGAIGWKWEGPEADVNRGLAIDCDRTYTLDDATHVFTEMGLLPVDKQVRIAWGAGLAGSSRRHRSKTWYKNLPVFAEVRAGIHLLRDASRRLRGNSNGASPKRNGRSGRPISNHSRNRRVNQ